MKYHYMIFSGVLLSPLFVVLFVNLYCDILSIEPNLTLSEFNASTTGASSNLNNATHFNRYYVSFGKTFGTTQGLGNQLFGFAATLYVAELTGRQPAIYNGNFLTAIDRVFDVGVDKYDKEFLCSCLLSDELKVTDAHFSQLAAVNDTKYRTIMLIGFYQNWKHMSSINGTLRRHLVFRRDILDAVGGFLIANDVPENCIKVGIHVRRGDIANKRARLFGFTVPDMTYFEHAMTYFVDRYASRIQFIVASNDMTWCRMYFPDVIKALNGGRQALHGHNVTLTFADTHQSVGEHLALLASCDHVIMSTGTFGWWAAWLANGETVYYADWPRNGSELAEKVTREDFFPPSWIGMT